MIITKGLIVRLEAKPGAEERVAAFLRDALPLVQQEPETVAWFAFQTGPRPSRSSTCSRTKTGAAATSAEQWQPRSKRTGPRCSPNRR